LSFRDIYNFRGCATTAQTVSLLEALHAQRSRLFGDAAAVCEPVAVLERPYSTVLRLRILTSRSAPSYAFAKVYKVRPVLPYETPPAPADLVREEFAATSRLHAALRARPGLSSPRPIASFPEYGAIVTQALEGGTLDHRLRDWRDRRRAPTLEAVASRIGAWLRAYQRLGGATGTWSVEAARRYLDDRLRHMVRLLGGPARDRALAIFDRIAAELPPAPEALVPIHADLCPGNILVMPGGRIAVLDLATAQAGTRYHDIAHLYLHLEFARSRLSRRRIDLAPVQATLLAMFDRPAAADHPLFRLMLLQHAVCHVTHLADTAGRVPRIALEALIRWRWRICLAMPALAHTDHTQ